jgi:hypothetical protein
MITTNHFLFLHLPKTGGSFVARHLLKIFPGAKNFDRHGFRCQIPEDYRYLPLVGCLRSPYDWYVSCYEFRWWVTHVETLPGVERHPRYPHLTFEDFVRLGNQQWWRRHHPELGARPRVGQCTSALINWFGKTPKRFLRDALLRVPTVGQFSRQIAGVRLLRTARLGRELAEHLRGYGICEEKLAAVERAPKLRPGPEETHRRNEDWHTHYTPGLKRYVRRQDHLVFELFPEFDV